MMIYLKKCPELIGINMLSSGFKVLLELSGSSVRAEVTLNAFGHIINMWIDLKSWRTSFTKKNYSVKIMIGPLAVSLIDLEKMNNYFENLIQSDKIL
jgi:hypothetical protein